MAEPVPDSVSKLGPNPKPSPTEVCKGCKQPRNSLSVYATEKGRRRCWHCIQKAS